MKCKHCPREGAWFFPTTGEWACSRHVVWWKRALGRVVTFFLRLWIVR